MSRSRNTCKNKTVSKKSKLTSVADHKEELIKNNEPILASLDEKIELMTAYHNELKEYVLIAPQLKE